MAAERSSVTQPRLQTILNEAERLREKLIATRRDFHMHPELSGKEQRTAGIVASWLEELGLEVRTGIGGYGVVGILRGDRNGPVVAYRADMDAIPSDDTSEMPYRSKVEGVKHGCGHDVHTTIGLGIASVLTEIQDKLVGTVIFIFQPAEETLEGARAMLADGLFDDPTPRTIFALHTTPNPVGTIGIPLDVGVPGIDEFEIILTANKGIDTLVENICRELRAMSTIPVPTDGPEVMKNIFASLRIENGPLKTFVNQNAEHQVNDDKSNTHIIRGWTRCWGDDLFSQIRLKVRQMLEEYTQGKADFNLTYTQDSAFPGMRSDAELGKAAIVPIEAAIGQGQVSEVYASFPYASEDFALFLQQIPGCMFWLGVSNWERGITAFNHMPDYDVDEEGIIVGTKAMANVLVNYLDEASG